MTHKMGMRPLQPEFCQCFEALDPKKIISRIEMVTKQSVVPGKTLLFLDEIQECPNAITALRYFKEKMPELHVIGAGSLLEFVLNETDLSFPVGRVQFLFLKPLSFSEFLLNTGEERIVAFLNQVEVSEGVPGEIHQKLLELLRLYLVLGGMPAAVQEYLKTTSLTECYQLQLSILQAYQSDFGKYATKAEYRYLQLLFEKAPGLVATHFKYANVSSDIKSREIKQALQKLCYAGLVNRVYSTAASGIPLFVQAKENRFKILFLDIGLLQVANKVDINELWQKDLLQVHSGRLTEQFVGQELLTKTSFYENPQLFFWKREKRGSDAEVDYLLTSGSSIIPLEVKAGATGRLRSLHQFMEEKGSPLGVKVSMAPLSRDGNILSVPLYMVDQIHRLIR